MIASMHVCDVGPRQLPSVLRRAPNPCPEFAQLLATAHLGGGLLPRPRAGDVALFAVWRDDAALECFLAEDPLAAVLAGGSSVRLAPLRVSGTFTAIPPLAAAETQVGDDEPVAVVTYGRLRLRRAVAFLRASARAEADAIAHPALAYGTGLTRPPRVVGTFSLWHDAAAMRDFAHRGAGHGSALQANAERAFHHESTFMRFRPYAATGDWAELVGAPNRMHN